MKIQEIRELATKDLVERLETEVTKLQQLKLNVRENLTNNNGPDGNKKFKKNKTGCRYQQQNG